VIVNADDLGEAESIDRGIFACHQAGIVKSASLLANGESLLFALEQAAKLPGLGLGIHLALVKGHPAAPQEKIPSLLFDNGKFAWGYRPFAQRYFTGGINLREVEYEWECQREKLGNTKIDHLDSHQHLHLLPALFKLTLKMAKKWGANYIRMPYENIKPVIKLPKLLTSRVLNLFCLKAQRDLRKSGIRCSDYFFGTSFSGLMKKPVWLALWDSIPEGVTEIMCHPGLEDAEIRRKYGWANSWAEEVEALTDAEVIDRARQAGIVFTNYREYMHSHAGAWERGKVDRRLSGGGA